MNFGSPTNIELLRLATELAYADYNNRRANLHNQWVADNDRMLKLYRTSVPYPIIPPYPTEEEIISKAQRLNEFLSVPRSNDDNQELQQGVNQLITDIEKNINDSPSDANPILSSLTSMPEVSESSTEEGPWPIATDNNTEEVIAVAEKTSVFGKLRNVLR